MLLWSFFSYQRIKKGILNTLIHMSIVVIKFRQLADFFCHTEDLFSGPEKCVKLFVEILNKFRPPCDVIAFVLRNDTDG